MNFKDIAAVAGKPGLYKIVKPTRSGVVLESLDAQKFKLVISSNTKVSILSDISMYTLSAEGNMPLPEIMYKIHETFKGTLSVQPKSEDTVLRAFFLQIVPDYDAEKVYVSDIKKLVSWYSILFNYLPEILTKPVEEPAEQKAEESAPLTENIEPTVEKAKPAKKKVATAEAKEKPKKSASTK